MAKQIVNLAKEIVVRLYALALMCVVIATAYTVVTYLFTSVFAPTQVPPWFLDWQGHLEADALEADSIAGVTRAALRAPLNHYHGVNRWFQPDPHNGCVASGCHGVLPHAKRKEMRAFANLHTTFLDCEICHDQAVTESGSVPVEAMWVAATTGEQQESPAILQLLRELEVNANKIGDDPAAAHPMILKLLDQAVKTIGGEPILEYLLVEMNSSEPGSPVWHHAVRKLELELPAHARGEYGAKVGLKSSPSERHRHAERLTELTREYFAAPPDSEEREVVNEKIHDGIIAQPRGCLACHGDDPARLDFVSLGYPPKRAADLGGSSTAKLMEQIMQGHPFHLPRVLEGRDGR